MKAVRQLIKIILIWFIARTLLNISYAGRHPVTSIDRIGDMILYIIYFSTIWYMIPIFRSIFRKKEKPDLIENRYFIVSYTGLLNGSWLYGETGFITSGCYLVRNKILSHFKDEKHNGSPKLEQVVITNILELSKSEYEEYYS